MVDPTKHSKTSVDPMCGRAVDARTTRFVDGTGNRKKYFCSNDCRQRYLLNTPTEPAARARKKGFWGRYLDRLNKTTGGKPPSCCG